MDYTARDGDVADPWYSERFDVAYRDIFDGCTALLDAILKQDKQWNEAIFVTEVVAALIWEGEKFMICQRPAHKARGLLWEFVGGKVEPGETKEQALIRLWKETVEVLVSGWIWFRKRILKNAPIGVKSIRRNTLLQCKKALWIHRIFTNL